MYKRQEQVRKKVRHCDRNCWMIGSVSPAMHKYIKTPADVYKRQDWLKAKEYRCLPMKVKMQMGNQQNLDNDIVGNIQSLSLIHI